MLSTTSENRNFGRKDSRLALLLWVVLTSVVSVGLWECFFHQVPSAEAQVRPRLDAGAQRKQLLEAQNKTNVKLDEIIRLLKSGSITVKVQRQAKPKPEGDSHGKTKIKIKRAAPK
ncbi:MAG: hypothetical protein K8S55_05995 [Phycisphaerae bacterium]|nr:hypothetical protein [Phycisphaerae bacterium]